MDLELIYKIDCKCGTTFVTESSEERTKWYCTKCREIVFLDSKKGMVDTSRGKAHYMTNKYFVERSTFTTIGEHIDSKVTLECRSVTPNENKEIIQLKELEYQLKIKDVMLTERDKMIDILNNRLDDLKSKNIHLEGIVKNILSLTE
ncbi:hypothetical protein ABHN03_16915 [Paenibacillus sp. NRS-1775]